MSRARKTTSESVVSELQLTNPIAYRLNEFYVTYHNGNHEVAFLEEEFGDVLEFLRAGLMRVIKSSVRVTRGRAPDVAMTPDYLVIDTGLGIGFTSEFNALNKLMGEVSTNIESLQGTDTLVYKLIVEDDIIYLVFARLDLNDVYNQNGDDLGVIHNEKRRLLDSINSVDDLAVVYA
jgi:hypothetical protein